MVVYHIMITYEVITTNIHGLGDLLLIAPILFNYGGTYVVPQLDPLIVLADTNYIHSLYENRIVNHQILF